jgi:Uma2 family endonuclease
LGNLALAEKLGTVFSDGALLVNETADLSTTPDAMFCSVKSFRAGHVRWVEWVEGSQRYLEVEGSPDLVIEVVSRTTVRKDTKRLPRLYFAAGIAEYWIIDARRDKIDFRILTAGRKKYVEKAPDADGYRRSRVLGRSFLLTREPCPAGGYWYILLER